MTLRIDFTESMSAERLTNIERDALNDAINDVLDTVCQAVKHWNDMQRRLKLLKMEGIQE